jgi:hypothetical protein
MQIKTKNWKTTASGVVVMAALVVKTAFPEYAPVCDAVLALGAAGVGLFAKDSNVTGGTVQQ